ncbi:hypothetical protein HZI73_21985 [Vallitalea pronyensis]|uniref:Uncharacterized protein n=1 Tax=Vallitalea pronyensis TaxID=1348613 RepID=A0A8J8SIU6_9FIRM|nr:hypothetical protein [Vallitalea pronyensis]QUI24807.1 hypothetical protein HZI73_21985 [Vallitalea pronyensis]
MNKIAFCLSGVLVLICIFYILLIFTIGALPPLYGNAFFVPSEGNFSIPFWISMFGIVAGLILCKVFYNKDKQ